MRASELVEYLTTLMEDRHCDPDIEIETGFSITPKRVELLTKPILDVVYDSRPHKPTARVVLRIYQVYK